MATFLFLLQCCLLAALASHALAAEATGCRVLSVVTNVASWVPTTGPVELRGQPKPTGYWLSEFTHSYTVFTDAGCNGGVGAADPQGFAFYAMDPVTQALVQKVNTSNGEVQIVTQTQDTVALSKVDTDDYDIVFFVGGTGAMWDFQGGKNKDIQRIVREMWESGKIVSAVCHGPMAFTDVKLSSGKYFVDGKTLTSFSNAEEVMLGKANVCALCGSPLEPSCDPKTCDGPTMPEEYPKQGTYLIESRLKANGAIYVATEQDWMTFHFRPHVVRHGRLVTGQNPGAGRETAEAVVDTYKVWKACKPQTDMQYSDTLCSGIQLPEPVTCQTVGYNVNATTCATAAGAGSGNSSSMTSSTTPSSPTQAQKSSAAAARHLLPTMVYAILVVLAACFHILAA